MHYLPINKNVHEQTGFTLHENACKNIISTQSIKFVIVQILLRLILSRRGSNFLALATLAAFLAFAAAVASAAFLASFLAFATAVASATLLATAFLIFLWTFAFAAFSTFAHARAVAFGSRAFLEFLGIGDDKDVLAFVLGFFVFQRGRRAAGAGAGAGRAGAGARAR